MYSYEVFLLNSGGNGVEKTDLPLILLIVGVVKVLFVSVCVVSVPTNVVVAFGMVTVLSAVGSATIRVVSCASAVAPSKTNLSLTSIVFEFTVVVVPDTIKSVSYTHLTLPTKA